MTWTHAEVSGESRERERPDADPPGFDRPLWDERRDLTARGEDDATVREMVAAHGEVQGWTDSDQPDARLRLAPSIAVLDADAEPILRHRLEKAVECLQILVRNYASDDELQQFLDVPSPMRHWIIRDCDPASATVDLCRIDLLGGSLGTVRALEFNASSPGTVITAGRMNRYWRRSSFGDRLTEWGLPPSPTEAPEWFADWLLGHGRRRGLSEDDLHAVGVFFDRFTVGGDLTQIHGQLARRGRETVQCHPEDFDPTAGVKLGYLKHIAQDAEEIRGWDGFCAAVTAGDLVIPNGLAERWVAENKLCLAALSDPRFRRLFDAEQCRALDALVPHSRKLGDGISAAEAERDRPSLVLKAPYGARGLSVVVGADVDEDEWSSAVRAPEHRGWLLQERIDPPTLPSGGRRDLVVGVVDGAVAVYASRINESDLLNITQGGAEESVFSPHPLEGGRPAVPSP